MALNKTYIQKLQYLVLMVVFGCMGPIVREIAMPPSVIACFRAWFSAAALIIYLIFSKKRLKKEDIKSVVLPMVMSGMLLSGDWIGLFNAYSHTTIATATVCYYMAPILTLIVSPIFLKEKLGVKHIVCVLAAFFGMILVSGVVNNGKPSPNDIKGMLFALLGASCYCCVIIINKKYPKGDAIIRTAIQLSMTAIMTTPYILMTENVKMLDFSFKNIVLLILLGVVFTAAAYIGYFYLMVKLHTRTVAIFSYADPVVAVAVSVFYMHEKITLFGVLGSILIISAAIFSEFIKTKNEKAVD